MSNETNIDKYKKWLRICDVAASELSTCSKRQYAAVILSTEGRVVGFGYNGSPPGHPHCNDGACPRLQENSPHGSNYDNCIAIHAETNALFYSNRIESKGGTLIVNGPPCFSCTKNIASYGLKKLVHYVDPAYTQWNDCLQFLEKSNIEVISVQRGFFTPEYFTKTEAYPPEWTQTSMRGFEWLSPPRHPNPYQDFSPDHHDYD